MRVALVALASPAADLLAEALVRQRTENADMRAALVALVEHMRRPAVQGQTVGAYRLGLTFSEAERVAGQGGGQ